MIPMTGRLHAMIDPDTQAHWGLNDEDRVVIRWALDAIEKLKAERDEYRRQLSYELHAATNRREKLRELARELDEMIG